jgi:thioredoxin-like negative regulator of GroEL
VIELLLEAERALEMGRVDVAETMFRQVADADPRNAIAVVGLARVAIEHGDDAGALALGRRALEIDPENAAAARLVARLEEVMTYRGEAVPEAAAPEPAAVPEAAAVPDPGPMPESLTAAASAPALAAPPKKRSWLDRLLRRNR